MRKLLCALIVMIGLTAAPAAAEEIATSAKACVVIDADTGRVLLHHNADAPLPMASTTKIMTALVALENASLEETVTAGRNAFGVPGTSIYLDLGESLTMEQMLYGLMLASGNDAAVAIAEHVAGSVDAFCSMMTARAEEIGCENTVFMTPHGLPNIHHHTTAFDMALIAREAMQNPTFRTIVSTQKMQIPWQGHDYDRVLTNKNKLLSTYEGATGIKTGYTNKAGRCLAFSAQRNGMELIGVVLNCPDWFDRAAAIMDEAFEKYEWVTLYNAGERVAEVEIIDGAIGAVGICALNRVGASVVKGTTPTPVLDLPDKMHAGIRAGDRVGTVTVYDGDRAVHSVALIAMEDAPEGRFRHRLWRVVQGWEIQAP